ncbi:hypothetical protein ABMA27_013879 [Loxostege sticticalis]|uniref:Uncharacterized protein n=1 Tax=Loxostege sticticalis TaxID=481309 RepID=A0ABR3IBU1_LOXSC
MRAVTPAPGVIGWTLGGRIWVDKSHIVGPCGVNGVPLSSTVRDIFFKSFWTVVSHVAKGLPLCRFCVAGFGFITFGDPSSVDKVLAQGTHELDGKKIDPKVAFPRRAHPKWLK